MKKCRRYAFHMKDGSPTIEALLVARRRHEFVVKDALILKSASESVSLDGVLEVPRENVWVMQEIR